LPDIKYHDAFPWRLVNGDTICHFECREHLQKYLDRYKLKPRNCSITHKDGKPFESREKHKRNVESPTSKKNNGSSSAVHKRKSSVDSTRNTSGNSKRKKNGK